MYGRFGSGIKVCINAPGNDTVGLTEYCKLEESIFETRYTKAPPMTTSREAASILADLWSRSQIIWRSTLANWDRAGLVVGLDMLRGGGVGYRVEFFL